MCKKNPQPSQHSDKLREKLTSMELSVQQMQEEISHLKRDREDLWVYVADLSQEINRKRLRSPMEIFLETVNSAKGQRSTASSSEMASSSGSVESAKQKETKEDE